MSYFISFIFLFVNLSFAKNITLAVQEKKPKPSIVKTIKSFTKKIILGSKEKKSNVPKARSKRARLKRHLNSAKKDVLPENYDDPKYSAKILKEDLETHLSELSDTCNQKNPEDSIKSKLDQIRDFLKDRLQDPYMDMKSKNLFSDILMLIKEEPPKSFTSESFKMSYKVAFGIRGEMTASDYPKWADQIEKALLCMEE